MVQKPRWLTFATAGVVALMVLSACTPAAVPTASPPRSTAPATPTAAGATPTAAGETPAATGTAGAETPGPTTAVGTPYPDPIELPLAPAAGLTEYPNYGGEVDCEAHTFNGRPYTGNLKKITATDPMTVQFEFCAPNVTFLSQIAFSALAIDDSDYLIAHMPTSVTGGDDPLPGGSILTNPNGTGPYMVGADGWDRGNRLDMTAFPNYWGGAALTPNFELLWTTASIDRLNALLGGPPPDGINNPDRISLADIEANADLVKYDRVGMNTFFVGMNNTYKPWNNVKARQAVAMAIDRDRLVDNFYPPGSAVADYFTPCNIDFACDGEAWPHAFDKDAARTLFAEALAEEDLDPANFTTKLQFRTSVRDYLPDPPVIAQDIAAQLQENLGITITLDQQDSGAFLANNTAGKLDGLFLLGWLADYPDTSNFLGSQFGLGTGKKFGDPYPDLVKAITDGERTPVPADRADAYARANGLLNDLVPMVLIAHGGGSAVFRSDVVGGHASPLNIEYFADVQAADRETLVFTQSTEPLSLYCPDETDGESFRACIQIHEALYGYATGGTDPEPRLATECTANEDLTVWTCALREGVTFHDGAAFAADDVILSFAAQWDAINPLHVGHTAIFEYWPALIGGGYLNPPGPCGLPNTVACPTG